MAEQALPRVLLHLGCGPKDKSFLPAPLNGPEWREIRVDLDPAHKPDVVASITHVPMLADGCADAIWCAHCLEHLFAHETPAVLGEARRLLKPGGNLMLVVPDAAVAAGLVAADRGDETIYQSPAGPVTAIDMLYGHAPALAQGRLAMAHRTCFTPARLRRLLTEAGFAAIEVTRQARRYELFAQGRKPQ